MRPIRIFRIGTSLSNRIRIGTSDSNSNRISKLRRCLVLSRTLRISETKFTVGKSKEMVFTAGKRRDRWGGNSTLLGEFPQEMYRKNTAPVWPWIDRQGTITVNIPNIKIRHQNWSITYGGGGNRPLPLAPTPMHLTQANLNVRWKTDKKQSTLAHSCTGRLVHGFQENHFVIFSAIILLHSVVFSCIYAKNSVCEI